MSVGSRSLDGPRIVHALGETEVPKQYLHMVTSRLADAGADLGTEALDDPDRVMVSDLICIAAAAGINAWLLFAQSPVVEATLAIACATT
jgi:hypothetical protein